MIAHHHTPLVVLSIVIAILGSYTALDLSRRVRANIGQVRAWWLAAAATAMGLSIWSMHFVAMLAFDVGMTVAYDVSLTALSLLIAIGVTSGAFAAVARPSPTWPEVLAAGLFMGLGICGMHYIGMAAMRLPANLSYNALLVALSVLIALGASTVALVLALREQSFPWQTAGAVVMGPAIAGMHYTAMAAAIFTPNADATAAPL
jgi:NO-binding membrane sensor protein with MHYT domain